MHTWDCDVVEYERDDGDWWVKDGERARVCVVYRSMCYNICSSVRGGAVDVGQWLCPLLDES